MDDTDKLVVSALLANGRASWTAIADALGLAETTVRRRGTRLMDSGLLAVTFLENPYRAWGGWPLLLMPRARPDRTLRLAHRLARMYPVKTVWVLDNGEILALVHPRDRDERNDLTLRHMPLIGDLLDLRTLPVLRAYTLAGPPQPPLLTAAQTDLIRHPYGVPGLAPGPRLDADEHHLVEALAVDGRMSLGRLAAATHTSSATAQRRLDRLRRHGGAEIATVVDRCQVGLDVHAVFFIQCDPATLADTVKQFTSRTAVHLAAAVTGPDNLIAAVAVPHTDDVHRLQTDVLPGLPGYRHARVHLVTAFVKESGMLYRGGHWQAVEP
ncbi:Lrp/AsnC family transcriptional regulator [Streptomyces yaizuensis]|uniref:Lrp/AsnC family transcriptional regulator n=1 Tax=Streptomyces yaizuensis TaxID=2989713 RepID=A0ABQ5NYS4_9ACTN|nr:Lrp/AsnC family transcriptional regulator [Streptomyces sp. YSPA8]GLF95377.1 Lrp/AsnC family transcriptional regulator [Streptomyces sp. YSPA8]